MKLNNSLENRVISKITSQKGRLLNFISPLVRTGLPLMENVLLISGKNVYL